MILVWLVDQIWSALLGDTSVVGKSTELEKKKSVELESVQAELKNKSVED